MTIRKRLRLLAYAVYLMLATGGYTLRAWEPPGKLSFSTENLADVKNEAAKVSSSSPCGVWSFPEEDSEVAIVPLSSNSDIYKIVMLYDVDMAPSPGTIIGYLAPTATNNKWIVWLYSKVTDKEMTSPKELVATFSSSPQSEEASLLFEKSKSGLKWHINPLGFLPFLRKVLSINLSKSENEKPRGLKRKATVHALRWL